MLRIDALTLAYGDQVVVRALTLEAAEGEVLCVLGPSGCGKSTLLRAIAGLEHPVAGDIHLDGQDLAGLRPDRRGVGLMFQDHALFPHRTVGDNVGFGPRMHGMSAGDTTLRVRETLALVGLAGMQHRRVTELSGGERQRVALARAIAPRPRLLMLDEPLGSLDRALQSRLLEELPEVFAEIGTTVLYVTHDQQEALSLADRVAVMRAGRLEQVGTPDELWRGPRTAFVARFLGLRHLLEVPVADGYARTPWGHLPVAGTADGDHQVVLLPDALRIVDARRPVRADELELTGVVTARRFAGDHVRLTVTPRHGPTLTVPVWRGRTPEPHEPVRLALDPTAVHVLGIDGTAEVVDAEAQAAVLSAPKVRSTITKSSQGDQFSM
jgi:thiamine transport system ATP-binding protein